MTSYDIVKALEAKYRLPEWVFLTEVSTDTGGGAKRIDAIAISCWSKKGIYNLRIAFEVKISRNDAMKDLLNFDKRSWAYRLSHQFFFVTPPEIIKPDELTRHDGLIEFDGDTLTMKKKAISRAEQPPSWGFVASVLRRQQQTIDALERQIEFKERLLETRQSPNGEDRRNEKTP